MIFGPEPTKDGEIRGSVSREIFEDAVNQQRALVRNRLNHSGYVVYFDDVMANIHSALWYSLNSWASCNPVPVLPKWANGVAVKEVMKWIDRESPLQSIGGDYIQEIEDDLHVATPDHTSPLDHRWESIWHAIRDRISAEPGGVTYMRILEETSGHGTRGKRYREVLQHELLMPILCGTPFTDEQLTQIEQLGRHLPTAPPARTSKSQEAS